jgi:hypothetical protein
MTQETPAPGSKWKRKKDGRETTVNPRPLFAIDGKLQVLFEKNDKSYIQWMTVPGFLRTHAPV